VSTLKTTNLQHPDAVSPNIVLSDDGSADLLVPTPTSTGAPWNIPYIDGGAAGTLGKLSEDVADAVAAGLSASSVVKQVVQTVKTDTFTTASTTLQDITGFAATITPTSNTSKILVVVDLSISSDGASANIRFQLVRASTNIYLGTAGTVTNRTGFVRTVSTSATQTSTKVFLDSPATDAAVTYKVQISTGTNNVFINRAGGFPDDGVPSSITLIEVAA
jgi:hypothetical protein